MVQIDERARLFSGDRDRLRRALCKQELIGNDTELADALMVKRDIRGYKTHSDLYTQGSATCGVFFILDGKVGLYRDGNLLDHVKARSQLGSWPILFDDPTYDVTATAEEDTICLLVDTHKFRTTANRFPEMWERLAYSQAIRLKASNTLYLPNNEKAKLLIGSSKIQLENARRLAEKIRTESDGDIDVQLWSDPDVFPNLRSYLESLTAGLDDWDFAIFLVTPDDEVISRDEQKPAPRDNIIFEAGLCVGRLGRTRTLLLVPDEPENLKIPSDLHGVSFMKYKDSVDEQLANILREISRLGPRTRLAIHRLED